MTEENVSPLVSSMSPTLSPLPEKKIINTLEIDFPTAINQVMMGKKVTKLEWNNPKIYVSIHDEYLCIHLEDNIFHRFIVRDCDMIGKDWVVTEEK